MTEALTVAGTWRHGEDPLLLERDVSGEEIGGQPALGVACFVDYEESGVRRQELE